MRLVAVESNMLSAIGFDPYSGELEAVFADGAIWHYRNVPKHVYQELLASASTGRYMRDFIIDVYPNFRIRLRS